eukprot:TRINITY_DN972_c0_g3_i3.p2 TRINITY_DN972_c0_g3~~TRINITY_DN972_c0_g3_i3.p2  ORF type:complete len:113 (+),score=14.08 TRINITY_DN972_c0_g3_i3:327-665(+)
MGKNKTKQNKTKQNKTKQNETNDLEAIESGDCVSAMDQSRKHRAAKDASLQDGIVPQRDADERQEGRIGEGREEQQIGALLWRTRLAGDDRGARLAAGHDHWLLFGNLDQAN